MPGKSNNIMFIAIICGVLFAGIVHAQDEDERRLWDSEFLKKRATVKAPATPATASTAPVRKTTAYRRVPPKTPAAPKPVVDEKAVGEMIGVTIWRLRQSRATDSQDSRLLLEDDSNSDKIAWTPERVEAETVFAANDRVRLSIESPRSGFLYVIDREQYADGTLSEPYLIFPTLRHRDGDNSVKAGKVIELPGGSAFRLKPMRADYTGEVLTLIVASEPFSNLKVGASISKLDQELVSGWEKQWTTSIERFELIGGAGTIYSKAEQEAGQNGARLLTQADDLPQTLYRMIVKQGYPLLVQVPLKIGK